MEASSRFKYVLPLSPLLKLSSVSVWAAFLSHLQPSLWNVALVMVVQLQAIQPY